MELLFVLLGSLKILSILLFKELLGLLLAGALLSFSLKLVISVMLLDYKKAHGIFLDPKIK